MCKKRAVLILTLYKDTELTPLTKDDPDFNITPAALAYTYSYTCQTNSDVPVHRLFKYIFYITIVCHNAGKISI